MLRPREVFRSAGRYLRAHPDELSRVLRGLIAFRFGLPIDAFRWLAEQTVDPEKVEGVEIEAQPPGLRLAGSFELMESPVHASAVIFIDRIEIASDIMRIDVRLEEVEMIPRGGKRSHISALLNAKALDLSRPGDLVEHLPDMPEMIVYSQGNKLGIDLMRVPKLAHDPRVRHVVGLLSSLITLQKIETASQHLDLRFEPLPRGFMAAADALADHLVLPGAQRAREMLPESVRAPVESGIKRIMGIVAGQDPGEEYGA